MLESFPEENPAWDDPQAEREMDLLMDVISGLRTIRTEAELHPTAKIAATIIATDADKRALLEAFSAPISTMIRAETLNIVTEAVVPDDAGHAMAGDVELFVPLSGLIDAPAELEKLARERKKLDKELARVSGKLKNEKFLANAPEAVVEKERDKEAEFKAKIAKNDESVARLKKLQ
jgi:valyl-tRNA synthetase